jgi:hypothetical protein
VQGLRYRHCRKIQSADGYAYNLQPRDASFRPVNGTGIRGVTF